MKYSDLLAYAHQMGARRAVARAVTRTAQYLRPLHRLPPQPTPAPYTSWQRWRSQSPWRQTPDGVRTCLARLEDETKTAVLRSARDSTRGHFICWGNQTLDFTYQNIINWHRDPLTGHVWPSERWAHLSLDTVSGTDIKTVWEASRMDWTGTLIRASLLTDSPRWSNSWWSLVDNWRLNNSYGQGVHWSNGQEIAIRALNLLWGGHTLRHLPDSAWRSWCQMLHEHGHAVAWHHTHTKQAVPNNHVLLEAVALLHLSCLLPWLPDTTRWNMRAQQSIEQCLTHQWSLDGDYIQRSHTYHRLALWALIWARPLVPGTLRGRIDAILSRANQHLRAQQGKRHGRLPCYGPSDGAYWPNITTCDYRDFRPLLHRLAGFSKNRLVDSQDPGIEEASRWTESSTDTSHTSSRSVPGTTRGASTILRHDADTFAMMIHGPTQSPFGQDDLMHVDLTWKGHDVTLDRGSYRYTGFPEAHRRHHGPLGHNTITIDGHGAREPVGYFSWKNVPDSAFEIANTEKSCSATRQGFVQNAGARHCRVLSMTDTGWRIEDLLEHTNNTCTIQWILPDGEYALSHEEGVHKLTLQTDALHISLQIEGPPPSPTPPEVVSDTWSPYYGSQVRALVFSWSVKPTNERLRWRTTFDITSTY